MNISLKNSVRSGCIVLYGRTARILLKNCLIDRRFGLTFMLGSAVGAGLLFTILVWVDSHVWIYLRKRKGYLQVAEQDPFLPLSSSGGSSGRGMAGGHSGSLSRGVNPQSMSSYSTAGTYPGRHVHYRHQHTPPQTPPFPGTL